MSSMVPRVWANNQFPVLTETKKRLGFYKECAFASVVRAVGGHFCGRGMLATSSRVFQGGGTFSVA